MKKNPYTRIFLLAVSLTFIIFIISYFIPSTMVDKSIWNWISVPPLFTSLPLLFSIAAGAYTATNFKETPLIQPETEFDDYSAAQNTQHYFDVFKGLWLPAFIYGAVFSLFFLIIAFSKDKICFDGNVSLTKTFILMILGSMSGFYISFKIYLSIFSEEKKQEKPFSGFHFAQRTKNLDKREFGVGYTGGDTRSVTRHS